MARSYFSMQSPVRFGCRMFAYLSSAPYQGQDEFVRQCLLTGGNSLQRQNQLPWGEAGDTNKVAEKHFDGIALARAEKEVRKAGWGIAYTSDPQSGKAPQSSSDASDSLRIEKSPLPTWENNASYPSFSRVSEAVADSRPKVIMAHLREAYLHEKQVSSQKNTHPFQYGDWALMQHGDLSRFMKNTLEDNLRLWKAKDAKSPLPKGAVDSERVACYIAARFRQQHGTEQIRSLKTEQVRDDFKRFVNEIMQTPGGYSATYNLVMSDGNRLFGTHQSMNPENMLIGRHRNPNGQEDMLIATDKIQPTAASGQAKIDWQPVAEDSVFSIERTTQADGTPKIDYHNESLRINDGSVKPLKQPGFWRLLLAWPRRIWNGFVNTLRAMGQAIRKFFRKLFGRKD